MSSPNRIDPLSFTLTGARQTPKNEFGQVLVNTLSGALKAGSAIVGQIPGMPVISAAVSAVTSVGGKTIVSANGPAVAQSAATGIVPLGGAPAAGAAADQPAFQSDSVREMAAMSDYYMKLQNEMQRESREFTAVSNIIKVRHDSAKAAINNIR